MSTQSVSTINVRRDPCDVKCAIVGFNACPSQTRQQAEADDEIHLHSIIYKVIEDGKAMKG